MHDISVSDENNTDVFASKSESPVTGKEGTKFTSLEGYKGRLLKKADGDVELIKQQQQQQQH